MKTPTFFHVLVASLLYKSDVLGGVVPNTVEITESKLPITKVVVERDFFGFSIEPASFIDFAGTPQSPNLFSQKLLRNLQDINGFPPVVRVGGNTADRTKYDPNVDVMVIDSYDGETSTPEPDKLRIGPGFYQAFKNLNATYTLSLNFASGDYEEALSQLKAGYSAIKDYGLDHVELGNEPDLYSSRIRHPWNTKLYAKQHSNFTQRLVHDNPMKDILVLGGISHSPKSTHNKKTNQPWNAKQILKDGIDTTHAKIWSTHYYPQSACSPSDIAKLSYSNLTSHSVIKANLDQYHSDITAANSKDLAFMIGEGNSVACHGADGISNTMVSAIWALDHVFYGTSIGLARVQMHNGRGFFSNVFQPNGTDQGVRPLYYAYVLAFSAIGRSHYVAPILTQPSTDNVVIYGIYDGVNLDKMVVINSQVYNTTTSGKRPSMTVQFKGRSGTLRRLTGPGADAKTGITFGGQSFSDKTGEITGTLVEEKWSEFFVLNATEAALVFISK